MTTTIKAIYEHGVFRPTASVELSEGTCVDILIPNGAQNRDPKSVAAKLAMLATKSPLGEKRETTARDHDQILYGGKI